MKKEEGKVSPNVINSGNVFYDGSNNLNVIKVDCNIMSLSPQECVNNPDCGIIYINKGWCGDNKVCIPGNFRGPLSPCTRSSYLYTKPTNTWNPLRAGTININTAGNMILTQQPDLNRIHVSSPYN